MRLRTLESYGLLMNGIIQSYPSLNENQNCDVLVVGGGITGALISHMLMENNFSTVLIDKRDIACGSTAATTSLLQYEIDVPLYRLSEQIGEEGAAFCYREGIKAVQQLGDIIKKHDLEGRYEKRESLYIARTEKDAGWLKKELEIRSKHQLGVNWLDKKNVQTDYGISCHGAILSGTAASVDAFQLTHSLLSKNVKKGLKVYDQTTIKKVIQLQNKMRIHTDDNHQIDCKKIIYCTGYESTKMLKEKVAHLFNTYAIVSEQNISVPEKLKKTLVWDTGSPYMYLRYTDDDRLLVGGEDSSFNFPFFQQYIKEQKSQRLQKRLKELIKDIYFIEDFSWGGTFGSTKDGLPYIGATPEYPNALFVLGFGGNGITFSVQAMDLVLDELKGKKNKLSHWYRFGR